MNKKTSEELAVFGGRPIFEEFKSTSNLLKPDVEKFLNYSKTFYAKKHYTNNGPNVRLLESRLASFHNTKHCVSFSSGFWALALAIKVLAKRGKTEVILPSLTYRRMTDMIAWLGLTPHFCEVNEETLAMCPSSVKSCVNENTAVILGVHPIVNCSDVESLELIANECEIPLVFDSVESVYESIDAGKIGAFGEAECFSLHACKLFNGFGGGYLTTNNSELAKQLSSMRTFGFVGPDNIEYSHGVNAKLNEMHACMALASLDDIDAQVADNKARYYQYRKGLASLKGFSLLEFDEVFDSGFKNIVARINDAWPFTRDETVRILNAEGVLARAHYDPPLHTKLNDSEYIACDLSLTESLATQFINLPCGQKVSCDDIDQIVDLLSFIEKHADQIKQLMPRMTEHD